MDPKQRPETAKNGGHPPEDRADARHHEDRESEPGSCAFGALAPSPDARHRGSYRAPRGPSGGFESYAAYGPPAVDMRFPVSMVRLLETFGSRFFVYSPERLAYVGRPDVAPQICKIIAGNAVEGQRLMRAVEDAYAEYLAVAARADDVTPKPIP